MMKRAFDVCVAAFALLLLFPILAVVAVLVKLDSPGAIFFTQERVGRRFRPFTIYKFRTMIHDPASRGAPITIGGDPRITRIGRFLRQTKIDELPQLFNVLRGDMSFVGPRPELSRYVEAFADEYREILEVRPGITDLASLKYRDEAAVLALSPDPVDEYVSRVLPEKLRLNKEYIARASFFFDLGLILKTLRVVMPRAQPSARRQLRS
jgi:lipopolysaccharide/colanic/teichoic acid biosynthesis glycosyltransferase